MTDDFNFTGDASWNTPRKSRTTTPTAIDGLASGQKRKRKIEATIEDVTKGLESSLEPGVLQPGGMLVRVKDP